MIKSHFLNLELAELDLDYDRTRRALWFYMKGEPVPCFTVTLLKEINKLFDSIRKSNTTQRQVDYLVAASGQLGMYNLGGDLKLFRHCVATRDQDTLRAYAYSCLDLGYACTTMLEQDVTTIALLEGNALGGGLEAALSCNVVIAEKNVRLGFPEILFNLFPGMGAYTYLRHRIHVSEIEKLLISGRNYTASEFHEMGIVDILADEGEGHAAVDDFIDHHSKQRNGRLAIHKAKLLSHPITLDELRNIADLWVDSAMRLDDKSLRVMDRLFRAQIHRTASLMNGNLSKVP